jgi:hypothetical protein
MPIAKHSNRRNDEEVVVIKEAALNVKQGASHIFDEISKKCLDKVFKF